MSSKFSLMFVKFLDMWFDEKQVMKKSDYNRIRKMASEVLK